MSSINPAEASQQIINSNPGSQTVKTNQNSIFSYLPVDAINNSALSVSALILMNLPAVIARGNQSSLIPSEYITIPLALILLKAGLVDPIINEESLSTRGCMDGFVYPILANILALCVLSQ